MPKLVMGSEETVGLSYYQRTKKRFVDEFNRIREKYELSNIVLVLDLASAKIISNLFTIIELVDKGIVFVQGLQKVRKKLDHHAIYFIYPTQQSIKLMLSDFEDKNSPQYRKVHVLLTSNLQQNLIKDISGSSNFIKRLAKHSFKQFYCEVQILSDNCLHFGLPYLQLAFSRESSKQKEMRYYIAKKMVDIIAGFQKLHTIRFLYDKDNSVNKVAQRVVQRSAKEVKSYLMRLLDSSSIAIDPKAPDLTILVVDRSIDVVTPLLHGYSYQGLLYDILDEKGNLAFEPTMLPKDLFDQYRYKHLSYVLSQLPERLNQLLAKVNNNKQKKNALQLKGMLEQKQKLNEHLEVLHVLWSKYQQKNIREIGELELCLATGVTEDGKQTASTDLVNQVKEIIRSNTLLNRNQLLRLALLVLSCVKVTKDQYQNIMDLFKEPEQRVLKNLVAFGITHDKKVSKSTKNIDKTTMQRARQLLSQKSISSQRFTSALQVTLPRFIDLLKKDVQSRKRMGEVVVSASGQEEPVPKFDEKRMVCFMCGGLSQTEICSLRRNSQLDSVLLASDIVMTPNHFVNSLKTIDIL